MHTKLFEPDSVITDAAHQHVPTLSNDKWVQFMSVIKGVKTPTSTYYNSHSMHNSNEWIIDTGTSNHMSSNLNLFYNLRDTLSPVVLPNEKNITVTKEGNINFGDDFRQCFICSRNTSIYCCVSIIRKAKTYCCFHERALYYSGSYFEEPDWSGGAV